MSKKKTKKPPYSGHGVSVEGSRDIQDAIDFLLGVQRTSAKVTVEINRGSTRATLIVQVNGGLTDSSLCYKGSSKAFR